MNALVSYLFGVIVIEAVVIYLTVIFANQLAENKKCELKIFDALGKIVFQSAVSSPQSSVDVSNYDNGIYFVQLNAEDKTGTQKLVIQH